MDPAVRQSVEASVAALKAVLAGECVNDVRLDDPGIDREWCERTLAAFQVMLLEEKP